jgi:hypothetical protein
MLALIFISRFASAISLKLYVLVDRDLLLPIVHGYGIWGRLPGLVGFPSLGSG